MATWLSPASQKSVYTTISTVDLLPLWDASIDVTDTVELPILNELFSATIEFLTTKTVIKRESERSR